MDFTPWSDATAIASTSNGCRYSASSSPFFQMEFESTKSRSFRFSLAG
jgi:hypothetical protein